MIKPIVRDIIFLSQKAEPATRADRSVGIDLLDTLRANHERCVGMAANMIGVKKAVIVIHDGTEDMVMFNPVIVKKDGPYEAEEGCLSLDGLRRTTRYQRIDVVYYDMNGKKRKQRLRGFPAQICQHEMDHLEGILI